MKLIRQDYMKPNFEELDNMIKYIDELYDLSLQNRLTYKELDMLLSFQDNDGSFKLVDSYSIESDCRIYYCDYPTQVITAIIINELLKNNVLISQKRLNLALERCIYKSLCGHGYDYYIYQKKIYNLFIDANVLEFIKKPICSNKKFISVFNKLKGESYYVRPISKFNRSNQ